MDKIANNIYDANFSFAYYKRYLKEEAANDMYNSILMHQVFEHSWSSYSRKT
jgi:hypothetical protein